MSQLKVLQSHPGCQLQDLGRRHVAAVGLTEGGVADVTAAVMANILSGNAPSAAVLEISLGGFQFEALGEVQIAITGAVLLLTINGKPQARYQRLQLSTGDVLTLGYAKRGLRAYVAVRGGFSTPLAFGSASTVLREQLGGVTGQALQAGECLEVNPSEANQSMLALRSVGYQWQPKFLATQRLQWVAGGQIDQFDPAAVAAFTQQWYQVTPQSDRMGYRLRGQGLTLPVGSSNRLLSEGICLGAIQLPPDGQPIVLLPDHQTIGGYPKIGALTRDSVSVLSQCRDGTLVQFQQITIEQAQSQRRQHWQWLLSGAYLI